MIRVLIVDDLKIIYHNLRQLFADMQHNIEVVGFAHNGQDAIKKTIVFKPDVILIDVLMPVMDGIKATQEITRRFPDSKVIGFLFLPYFSHPKKKTKFNSRFEDESDNIELRVYCSRSKRLFA